VNIVRYPSPRVFLDAVESLLLADEAGHNLLLGIPARLTARGRRAADGSYFAAAVDRGNVVAAAMMTPPWNLVLSNAARPGAVRGFARDAMTISPAPPGVNSLAATAAQFAADWHELTGQRAERTQNERIHRLDTVRLVPGVDGCLRDAGRPDRPLLVAWLEAFAGEAFGTKHRRPGEAGEVVDTRLSTRGEGFVVWEDGAPRCVAGFGGVTRNGIRIGPVYTPPEHRGHGYATACVAALSRRLLEGGRRFCMLYTDLANPTSNRIYRRIGYEPICDVDEYRFLR
jgi:uncharacterized protein